MFSDLPAARHRRRSLLELFAIGVMVLASLLLVLGLTRQALAHPTVDRAQLSSPVAAQTLTPSTELTYHLSLPLVAQQHDGVILPFGVQFYGALTPGNGFAHAVDADATWVRAQALWSVVEPVNTTPDNFNWTALDESLGAAQAAHVNVLVTIENNPAWASPWLSGPVDNVEAQQEFVGALVARYPQITYWEFYNEPDRVEERFGFKAAQYAAMLSHLYPVVKAANPKAQVVMGGLALDWFTEEFGPFDSQFLTNVLQSCVGTCFDVANFHYYPGFRARWEPYGTDIVGKANFVRQILAQHNFVRPVINSEAGWPSATVWGNQEIQARYVPKLFIRSMAAKLPVTIWYAMRDADTSEPGLLGEELTPRLAYTAFWAMTDILGHSRLVRRIPTLDIGTAYVEGYEFYEMNNGTRHRLDVYWYDCPSLKNSPPVECDAVAPLRLHASRVAKIDKLGNRQIVDDTDDGYRDGLVTLGVLASPIYIDYAP